MPGSEKNLSMETLKLGVLGCGRMVRHHVKQIREMDDAEIVALCDVSVDIADAFRKENFDDEPVRCFDDADQMYDEGGIQGVLITTPHTLHFEQAMRALDAGCHVFVEKPMVTKSEDGKTLKDKVQETGKVLTVGYNTPCRATFGRLREMIPIFSRIMRSTRAKNQNTLCLFEIVTSSSGCFVLNCLMYSLMACSVALYAASYEGLSGQIPKGPRVVY